jgi:very-short-patch-repair endonuclease
MTDAERKLWFRLRSRQVAGVRFNTQYPVGAYICDFAARSKGLVIETRRWTTRLGRAL